MIPSPPAAKHTVEDGHDTEASWSIPAGAFSLDQLAPPFVLTMMELTSLLMSPTATHVAVLADALGAQDTALTLTCGEKEAVVCQTGVAAAEGVGAARPTVSPTMVARPIAAANVTPAIRLTAPITTSFVSPERCQVTVGMIPRRVPLKENGGRKRDGPGRGLN
jgi:hypothetical protein